jgi:hypothetical protein
MPKKSRRAKAKRHARTVTTIQARHPQQLNQVAPKPQLSAKVSPGAQDFVGRYQYVMPEVKRIGILAGSIVLILIILSFVLS